MFGSPVNSSIVRFNIFFRSQLCVRSICLHNRQSNPASTKVSSMSNGRNHTLLMGLAFLTLLIVSYFANIVFFETLNVILQNQLLGLLMIFAHNIIVVSLVLLGMTFYVNLVTFGFFKREKYANVVLDHPKTFAIVFASTILLLSILRGTNLFLGSIIVEALPMIFLISAPIGIIEGYGIYLAIKKTLSRTIVAKDLVGIYGIFLVAAAVEVGFISALK